MLDLIFIMGIMLSTACLLRAPCRHRQRPCREDDTGACIRVDLQQQKDTLYTAIGELECDFQTSKVEQQDYAEPCQQFETDGGERGISLSSDE